MVNCVQFFLHVFWLRCGCSSTGYESNPLLSSIEHICKDGASGVDFCVIKSW